MKKIEAWKTSDNRIWRTKEEAIRQQEIIDIGKYFSTAFSHMSPSRINELINFLIDYRDKVLKYYSTKK